MRAGHDPQNLTSIWSGGGFVPPSPWAARIGPFGKATCYFLIGCDGSVTDAYSNGHDCWGTAVTVGARNAKRPFAAYIRGVGEEAPIEPLEPSLSSP